MALRCVVHGNVCASSEPVMQSTFLCCGQVQTITKDVAARVLVDAASLPVEAFSWGGQSFATAVASGAVALLSGDRRPNALLQPSDAKFYDALAVLVASNVLRLQQELVDPEEKFPLPSDLAVSSVPCLCLSRCLSRAAPHRCASLVVLWLVQLDNAIIPRADENDGMWQATDRVQPNARRMRKLGSARSLQAQTSEALRDTTVSCNSTSYASGGSCIACTVCGLGYVQLTPCTATSNTLCQGTERARWRLPLPESRPPLPASALLPRFVRDCALRVCLPALQQSRGRPSAPW